MTADPFWYKDAVIYELHVRAFFDSNGDGIGDFRGLAERIEYLQDLGVTALWLLPFYPSPLRDDGYDIADYGSIHPDYGTLPAFRAFLHEAHRRGIRVITELVVNHTSDQHPWFQEARASRPGSAKRNFYVWNDAPDRYADARIIFKDFETSNWSWDQVAKAYYWHRFYHHQPDLNFENPAVKRALLRALDFWLGMGVDGLRLDAVPYLYEAEGSNCENLPETHGFLKELRRHVDRKYDDRMLLAEANQWPEDAIAYFGEGTGDECHMAFHFPLMPRLFMALSMEDRFPVIDILDQTPAIPESCQWAVFLRNHDELTLEMVTDEERDYMYRVYAHDRQMRINLGIRRRLAPLLGNNRRKIELLNGILFSMPGTPVIYYGDELGMGDNIYLGDRNGVRTPLQWSPDRNAGFSSANPQRLYLPVIVDPEYHYEAVNIEVQRNNPGSLLWWMKRLISLRKRYRAFSRGALKFVYPENRHVLAYIREYEDEHILVVANLSRFPQYVELHLGDYEGMTPIELFGGTEFPRIGGLPYLLTLGPHAFYWFSLEHTPAADLITEENRPRELNTIQVHGDWTNCLNDKYRWRVEAELPRYLSGCRWFGGKSQRVTGAEIVDAVPLSLDARLVQLAIVTVSYRDANDETYVLPLAFAQDEKAMAIERDNPHTVIARIELESRDAPTAGILFDALFDNALTGALLSTVSRRRTFKGKQGDLATLPSAALRKVLNETDASPAAHVLTGEQTNTSVVFGDKFIMKVFRRLDEGVNPDVEIGRFLTDSGFANTPPVVGTLEYQSGRQETTTVAVVQSFVRNEGDAWSYTLDELRRYLEARLANSADAPALRLPPSAMRGGDVSEEDHAQAEHLIGAFLGSARLLGKRTAELHQWLASNVKNPAFAPEAFSTLYQRSVYQSMRNLARNALDLLQRKVRQLPEAVRPDARLVLEQESAIFQQLRSITGRKINATRIRCHGDYHLGQVLFTGNDYVIMDFEGEPARPISERRLKRCPLRDVAGMLRSFDYACWKVFGEAIEEGIVTEPNQPAMRDAGRYWFQWICHAFLSGYLEVAEEGRFIPRNRKDRETLLNAFLIEKALYEIRYELNSRPDWVGIPLRGLLETLSAKEGLATDE